LTTASLRQPGKLPPNVIANSGNNHWHTPPNIIQAAREVMGQIDLDPASDRRANTLINAAKYYSPDDDGLIQEWRGRIWLNPPYSRALLPQFATKLAAEIADGNIIEAIVLVNAGMETKALRTLTAKCPYICFPRSRVSFLGPDDKPVPGNNRTQVILYHGAKPQDFIRVFSTIGETYHRVTP